MTKTKKKKSRLLWILVLLVIVVLSAFYSLSKNNAVAKIKALPEVINYLQRVPNGLVAVNGEEDNAYLIQAYEFKDGHTETFNWYKVDKTTGEVKKEF